MGLSNETRQVLLRAKIDRLYEIVDALAEMGYDELAEVVDDEIQELVFEIIRE